ncbi:hypothetical protein [Pseudomonas monteilii]|uniref:hypothetical protein n=1 Tax=Pseudomonas monteilii TaxID=76759 RepID=UPI001E46DA78|nr:hypothetical protein [Pseudomonas monteilii]MCE0877163.1 hypothetical protein [Pseudomonas monteilii]MCE0929319.1 hypothetical protein [Pseudomonas monteilii]MCE0935076.1 hypothetical protein [Pseudomonas monteilii]MCE1015593.1 hypothetical protein [Pseudomonas monteilii]MCE1044290.1 hypothetical protein [Pseudomonas monteilii]
MDIGVLRTKFKLAVHEANGQKYEDLFVRIMMHCEPGFQPVKPHGNIGDRGNDGWISASGRYFQCYAPEDLPANTEAAIAKLKKDFGTLKSYWETISPVREFCFVINDKFQGASPHIYQAVSALKIEHGLSNAEVLLSAQLEEKLFSQRNEVIADVVGALVLVHNAGNVIYNHLITQATQKLELVYWLNTSDNLIAGGIPGKLVDSFGEFTAIVFRTNMPGLDPELESAVHGLAVRIDALVNHFTHSEHSSFFNGMWSQDRSWKRIERTPSVYRQMDEASQSWRVDLFYLHRNLVHALNIFAACVRNSIAPGFFMGQSFVVNDSLGTYNGLQGYELIPNGFIELEGD